MSLIEELVNVIAPHECLACYEEGELLCANCTEVMPSVPGRCYSCSRLSENGRTCVACRRQSHVYSVQAATLYENAAKELVRRLKFERARSAADTIARIMTERGKFPEGVIITHIPTANARVRSRGYDQAALIARALAQRTGNVHLPLLARIGTQRQLGQQRKARKEQMRQAFRPINNALLQKRQVLLVDDVLTTGATCEAAARTLREAGSARVSVYVFAVA